MCFNKKDFGQTGRLPGNLPENYGLRAKPRCRRSRTKPMPLNPFTLTDAAVRHLARDRDEYGDPDDGFRIRVDFIHGEGSRQYHTDIVAGPQPDDVVLDYPDGQLKVYVPRESFMRLWGYVLDVKQVDGAEPGQLGGWFRESDLPI